MTTIACSLNAATRAERAARWQALGDYELERLDNGIRLTFAGDVHEELTQLAVLERECCAFADWTVSANTIAVTAATAEAVAAVHALRF